MKTHWPGWFEVTAEEGIMLLDLSRRHDLRSNEDHTWVQNAQIRLSYDVECCLVSAIKLETAVTPTLYISPTTPPISPIPSNGSLTLLNL
jgi:hypothetical protein